MKKILKNLIDTANGKKHRCSVCGNRLKGFQPLNPYFTENIKKHEYIYGNRTPETCNLTQYSCSVCGASDRDRLYVLYLSSLFKKLDKNTNYTFLDIAPSGPLSTYFFNKYPFIKRRTADLMAKNVDDKLDIMDMKLYEDNSYDFFLCSHVLEHVTDPDKAMRELYRVLKKGGKGIAMVPIILGLDETFENPAHVSEADRWRFYGQGDHLRAFGKKDFVRRLESAGFTVQQLGVTSFDKKAFAENCIMDYSVLYVVEKSNV